MRGHITRASTVAAAALLLASGAVAPAGARPALDKDHSCDDAFVALENETAIAEFTNPGKDQGGLMKKATDAQTKFQDHKVTDSLQKLSDYWTKVDSLVTQNKVEDASKMLAAHADAVTCVS